MDLSVSPDVGPLLFVGLSAASFVTAFIAVFTGAAGGVILLAIIRLRDRPEPVAEPAPQLSVAPQR